MKEDKPNWCNVILRFPHEITADKITIFRRQKEDRVLLGQICDATDEEYNIKHVPLVSPMMETKNELQSRRQAPDKGEHREAKSGDE